MIALFDVRGGARAGWRAGSCAGCCAGSNPRRAPGSASMRGGAQVRERARVPAPACVCVHTPAQARTPRTWRTSRPAAGTPCRTVLAPAHILHSPLFVEKQEAVS